MRRRGRFGEERGSVSIEAAVTLPLFLAACVSLVWLLQLARIEATLQEAVDEAVKSTAAHAYPLDLVVHSYRSTNLVQEWEQRLERFLPYAVKSMLQNRLQREMPLGGDAVSRSWSEASLHQAWAVPLVMQFADRDRQEEPYLRKERLTIRSVVVPTFMSDETSYFGISAEYRIKLPIPFVSREVVLTAASIERCWVGEK
ncbi:hypothetical protein MO973_19460 [Paenibacillus sp. TRM 82003]|nr:hypothetical protein [Paenibacillus sp. TRM 82003]